MPTKVTSKGQVTIPKAVRTKLGIEAGTSVTFDMHADGRVVLQVAGQAPESRFAKLRGHAGQGMSTDEIMALTRGDA